jgi:hypothetical protein
MHREYSLSPADEAVPLDLDNFGMPKVCLHKNENTPEDK